MYVPPARVLNGPTRTLLSVADVHVSTDTRTLVPLLKSGYPYSHLFPSVILPLSAVWVQELHLPGVVISLPARLLLEVVSARRRLETETAWLPSRNVAAARLASPSRAIKSFTDVISVVARSERRRRESRMLLSSAVFLYIIT